MASNTIKKLSSNIFKNRSKGKIVEEPKPVVIEDENSLSPHDHDGDYELTAEDKQFVSLWIEFKNLVMVSGMMDITVKEASKFLANEHIRNEIARISKARMYKRFDSRQLTIDNMLGWLSSLITGENVPVAEQLSEKEKLVAMKLYVDVEKLKLESMTTPSVLDNMPVMEALEDVSTKTLRTLLRTCSKNEKQLAESIDLRQKVASQIPYVVPEEEQDIMSMSPDELRELIEINEKAKKSSQEKKDL